MKLLTRPSQCRKQPNEDHNFIIIIFYTSVGVPEVGDKK